MCTYRCVFFIFTSCSLTSLLKKSIMHREGLNIYFTALLATSLLLYCSCSLMLLMTIAPTIFSDGHCYPCLYQDFLTSGPMTAYCATIVKRTSTRTLYLVLKKKQMTHFLPPQCSFKMASLITWTVTRYLIKDQ